MNTLPDPVRAAPLPSHQRGSRGEAPPLQVVVVRDEAALAEHVGAWQELARHAVEPNPFYEPWLVLPALRSFGTGELRFVFVYGPTIPPSRRQVLLGFFPITTQRLSRLLPVNVIAIGPHLY